MVEIHDIFLPMRVLIACEESQEVCKAFRALGHEAFSCDVKECSGGHPEWHIVGDALDLINGDCTFQTSDTHTHTQRGQWDLLIAHPPCTFLTAASAVRLFAKDGSVKDLARYQKGKDAAEFFMEFTRANADRIAIENPVPLKCFGLPPYSQIIEPYMFGDPWRKRTCLWLINLPILMATDIVVPKGLWVGSTCANRDPKIYTKYELTSIRDQRRRSKTFPGVARAMAEQWGSLNENEGEIP